MPSFRFFDRRKKVWQRNISFVGCIRQLLMHCGILDDTSSWRFRSQLHFGFLKFTKEASRNDLDDYMFFRIFIFFYGYILSAFCVGHSSPLCQMVLELHVKGSRVRKKGWNRTGWFCNLEEKYVFLETPSLEITEGSDIPHRESQWSTWTEIQLLALVRQYAL